MIKTQNIYSLWYAANKIKRPTAHISPFRMENRKWDKDNKEKADNLENYV